MMAATARRDVRGPADLLRTCPPGRPVVVTLGPVLEAEHVAFALAAMRTVRPDLLLPSAQPTTPPADGALQRRMLEAAGVVDVEFATTSWEVAVASADDLLDLACDEPAVADAIPRLVDGELDQVRQILGGMLRERSGGSPGALLRTEVRIATGTTSRPHATPHKEKER